MTNLLLWQIQYKDKVTQGRGLPVYRTQSENRISMILCLPCAWSVCDHFLLASGLGGVINIYLMMI